MRALEHRGLGASTDSEVLTRARDPVPVDDAAAARAFDGVDAMYANEWQSNMFFKLMDERYRRRSTIITTNLEFDQWHNFLGRKDMVAALLDRLRHHCTVIKIEGRSLRNPENE